jgi:hypothetical protein
MAGCFLVGIPIKSGLGDILEVGMLVLEKNSMWF